jgi:hypothetical protein
MSIRIVTVASIIVVVGGGLVGQKKGLARIIAIVVLWSYGQGMDDIISNSFVPIRHVEDHSILRVIL